MGRGWRGGCRAGDESGRGHAGLRRGVPLQRSFFQDPQKDHQSGVSVKRAWVGGYGVHCRFRLVFSESGGVAVGMECNILL